MFGGLRIPLMVAWLDDCAAQRPRGEANTAKQGRGLGLKQVPAARVWFRRPKGGCVEADEVALNAVID